MLFTFLIAPIFWVGIIIMIPCLVIVVAFLHPPTKAWLEHTVLPPVFKFFLRLVGSKLVEEAEEIEEIPEKEISGESTPHREKVTSKNVATLLSEELNTGEYKTTSNKQLITDCVHAFFNNHKIKNPLFSVASTVNAKLNAAEMPPPGLYRIEGNFMVNNSREKIHLQQKEDGWVVVIPNE